VSAADLEAAATDYYGVVGAGDLEASYERLSPAYQERNPFDQYVAFWTEDVTSVAVQGRPRADVEALTVDLTLRFGLPDGGESVETARLTFARAEDGSLLIDRYESGGQVPAADQPGGPGNGNGNGNGGGNGNGDEGDGDD
jgi:hypothetical protein